MQHLVRRLEAKGIIVVTPLPAPDAATVDAFSTSGLPGGRAEGTPTTRMPSRSWNGSTPNYPTLHCLGLCGHSCAHHVDASETERVRIAQRGVDLDAPITDGSCPALSRALGGDGRCTVYEVRPMVCRVWGPHGCRPEGGPVPDTQALRWMVTSLEIGGHRDDGTREMLERCLADPTSTQLLGRLLRGDRSVATELRAYLLTHP